MKTLMGGLGGGGVEKLAQELSDLLVIKVILWGDSVEPSFRKCLALKCSHKCKNQVLSLEVQLQLSSRTMG